MSETLLNNIIDKFESDINLANQLNNKNDSTFLLLIVNQLKTYLPIEKEQIINAFNQGYREGSNDSLCGLKNDKDVSEFDDAEIYYKNRYKI